MVNEIQTNINDLSGTYNKYQIFLKESLNLINNQSQLQDYLNFVEEKVHLLNSYLENLNSENSIHLYGLIGGVCRYFSEFNWFDDYDFYIKVQDFKNKLTEESQIIYDYYHRIL